MGKDNSLITEEKVWDTHYTRSKSVLLYPDENLVRMLKAYLAGKSSNEIKSFGSIDLGCGSGRHLKLINESGIQNITGLDTSLNALKICKELYPFMLVQASNDFLPFRNSCFDFAISWGSLHYCTKEQLPAQIAEINRVIKKGGFLFGTLRSEMDTYLKKGRHLGNDTWITDLDDIKKSVVSFYSENELKSAFKIFSTFEYGIIERTIIGDIHKRISHWIFRAGK
jgi:ubiquinone/menaquinone biosynthesis C-methylase UbiE